MRSARALVALTVAAGTLTVGTLTAGALAGCGADPPTVVPGTAVPAVVPDADRALVDGYVAALNAAADAGTDAQARLLAATQAEGTPLPPPRCFGTVVLRTRAVARTLRSAPDWLPPGATSAAARPVGAVYVVAVSVTASRDGTVVREDIGPKHFVVRDGRVRGYAACPT